MISPLLYVRSTIAILFQSLINGYLLLLYFFVPRYFQNFVSLLLQVYGSFFLPLVNNLRQNYANAILIESFQDGDGWGLCLMNNFSACAASIEYASYLVFFSLVLYDHFFAFDRQFLLRLYSFYQALTIILF